MFLKQLLSPLILAYYGFYFKQNITQVTFNGCNAKYTKIYSILKTQENVKV